ncbi:MAG: AraC family transcriptional regulator, partial [Clostridia bacterium]|nr:AraC family transcriptional regulator [Clostridia bacterium]
IYMSGSDNIVTRRKLIDKGRLISVRPHTRFVSFPEHTHDYIEIVYMCSGNTTHIINGREINLAAGELLFLSRHAKHKIMRAEEQDIAVNFIVMPEFFENALSVIGSEETPLKKFISDSLTGSGGPDYLHFKVSEVMPVQNLVENLIWTLLHDVGYKRSIYKATMELLFLHLLGDADYLVYDTSEDGAVLQVLRYIEDNYRNGSLSEAAEILHYDLYWLSREIKHKTGRNYTDFVQDKRLSQAVFYLTNTNMKISDIAIAVGYDNTSYFHRLFSARYGVSPKKYRDCK